jgi:hypothetical protein
MLRRLFGRGDRGNEDATPSPPLPDRDRFAPDDGRVFRVVRTVAGVDPRSGKQIFRSGVSVSLTSSGEAELEARENAQRNLEAALADRKAGATGYAYHVDKRAEPVVDELRSAGTTVARITVNAYGAMVMNAARAMFVDVDLADDGGGRESAPPDALADLVSRRPDLGFRAYRTRGGWRYLCTTIEFDPSSNETATLLRELRSDEKYVLLCAIQRSFRARLTPKPWRARQRPLDVRVNGVAREQLQRYIDRTWKYATARFVATIGTSDVHAHIAPVLEYHDRWTQATREKQLA